MSLFVKLMIASWTTAIAMIGFCALHQSGNLLKIRKRMALWLETSAPQVSIVEESLQPEGGGRGLTTANLARCRPVSQSSQF
jgi:hypothetical protein